MKNENIPQEHLALIPRVAAKLFNEGITTENYTKADAEAVLDRVVAPVACKKLLGLYEERILKALSQF